MCQIRSILPFSGQPVKDNRDIKFKTKLLSVNKKGILQERSNLDNQLFLTQAKNSKPELGDFTTQNSEQTTGSGMNSGIAESAQRGFEEDTEKLSAYHQKQLQGKMPGL